MGIDFDEPSAGTWYQWFQFDQSDQNGGVGCTFYETNVAVYVRNATTDSVSKWTYNYGNSAGWLNSRSNFSGAKSTCLPSQSLLHLQTNPSQRGQILLLAMTTLARTISSIRFQATPSRERFPTPQRCLTSSRLRLSRVTRSWRPHTYQIAPALEPCCCTKTPLTHRR